MLFQYIRHGYFSLVLYVYVKESKDMITSN